MRSYVLTAALAAAATAQQDAGELSIAFVGKTGTERTTDFAEFLQKNFAGVAVVERKGCDPDSLRDADVVIVDWSQHDDGIMTWIKDREAPRVTPLGDRASWDRPTVLIGSAGLNLATAWDLPGSFG